MPRNGGVKMLSSPWVPAPMMVWMTLSRVGVWLAVAGPSPAELKGGRLLFASSNPCAGAGQAAVGPMKQVARRVSRLRVNVLTTPVRDWLARGRPGLWARLWRRCSCDVSG